MSLLKPQRILADNDHVKKIYGVGKMTQRRLERYGIHTVGEIKAWIQNIKDNRRMTPNQKKRAIEQMVNSVTKNKHAGECIEGYSVRIHNRISRNALVRFIRDQCGLERLMLPPYGSRTRSPPLPGRDSHRFAKELVVATNGNPPYEGNWKWPYGPLRRTALADIQVFPHGKIPKMPDHLTQDERNNLIRSEGSRHRYRQNLPCTCFRSRNTCRDFSRVNHNRRTLPIRPYCEWDDVVSKCRDDRYIAVSTRNAKKSKQPRRNKSKSRTRKSIDYQYRRLGSRWLSRQK